MINSAHVSRKSSPHSPASTGNPPSEVRVLFLCLLQKFWDSLFSASRACVVHALGLPELSGEDYGRSARNGVRSMNFSIRAFNVQAYVAWRRFPPTASSLWTSRLNVGEQPFDSQPLALQKQGLAEVHGSDFGFGAFDSYNPRREQVPPFAASLCFLSFGYRFPNVCAARVLKSGILQVTSKMLSWRRQLQQKLSLSHLLLLGAMS